MVLRKISGPSTNLQPLCKKLTKNRKPNRRHRRHITREARKASSGERGQPSRKSAGRKRRQIFWKPSSRERREIGRQRTSGGRRHPTGEGADGHERDADGGGDLPFDDGGGEGTAEVLLDGSMVGFEKDMEGRGEFHVPCGHEEDGGELHDEQG